MKILVCIASHDCKNRLAYLLPVLNNLKSYPEKVDIIIDTNDSIDIEGVSVYNHNLLHPYHLTWCHRKHIKDNLLLYDWFVYQEDDMLIPYENFHNYTENFNLLWDKYVPSFVRIEKYNNKEYITDVTSHHKKSDIICLHDKKWIHLSNPYHAFWIMPKQAIINTITKNFERFETWRELAASYPMWELKRIPLVMIEDDNISKKCYSYHLPNNYASFQGTPFGKIEINKLFT